ncbi:MAG: imidazoleglycerol-phosphate dehydratase HisB [Pseudodesulfovibrio sp.]|uniref:Imidazoleglycerol-phosphate dehydratase n=1 Tax=Pseudodesulfovibrio aespoeensis (strain ATCC 700646 / DSM 10631 / Aspo-2) TaxID=643562 RepID=E6VUU9_PSEA9|nr:MULTISPECIES: imidazoleglycerol-phosphate dehydratase HisB [Pseudodesulfovibrio]MBU4192712.1 imidazoleglycerol-phosphate dehydratase HisB [Pseudomonadota bacterium]ADU63457.1 Imidazoleglycerol-phosphate dehydratase [Pseudodesulfovibrio aespoeensis Aspo-2]MBU4243092.1 imidazoleglycerol-phosphate dehydratase HisB [Pseudomonadota bacterium]MBU4378442.1 imidazoleglycerol-phosphate dehydratase HisB [Pseudomonadota bacterium]MBU4474428.1 imidazoleglycerol-phosphate dehydratase HisB [Pseudomonadot
MGKRTATVKRATKETDISLTLTLEGEGRVEVDTGIGFADHMLTLAAFWAGFDLDLTCKGDLEIDSHHSLEDIGLCLGQALSEALGDKRGIVRVASAKVPMDEALAEVVVDLSGRPYIVYDDALLPDIIAGDEKDIWREFLKSFAYKAGMNLHVRYEYGQNGHHLLEAAFKAMGIALAQAVRIGRAGVSSTKGSLD